LRSLFFVAFFFATPAFAVGPEVPELRARVTDLGALLSATEAAKLEATLAAYETKTGHQFAFLSIPSLEGDVIDSYSLRVVEKWKLGDAKRDDGLLLLVAVKDRKARIEVGYGLEGAVSDAFASRVIRYELTPAFKESAYAVGIERSFEALMKAAEGEAVRVGPEKAPPGKERSWFRFLPLLLIVLLVVSGRGGMLPWLLLAGGGGGRRGGGGGFGGFSGGGGGGFGGGGASGDW
jgi:uncharacterized protein